MIRPMRPDDDAAVRAIYAACHPTWPPPPPRWYEAHPGLVALSGSTIVGFCSYSVGPALSTLAGETMTGYGIDVAPGHQGEGHGRRLCDARLDVARAVGAKLFVGHCAPENAAMLRLFERDGFKPHGEAKDPDGGRVLLFVGPVQ